MRAEDLPFHKKTRAAKPCPICGKPPAPEMAPFCSRRCADVDLHRWLGGIYVVPEDEPGRPETPDGSDR